MIGDERRTLKLMLAVANGAWLVSPQWVTASLEAGRWLPESQFPAKVGWGLWLWCCFVCIAVLQESCCGSEHAWCQQQGHVQLHVG